MHLALLLVLAGVLLFGLALGMGVRGFWLGSSLAGTVIGIIGAIYYFSGKWKTRKLLV